MSGAAASQGGCRGCASAASRAPSRRRPSPGGTGGPRLGFLKDLRDWDFWNWDC